MSTSATLLSEKIKEDQFKILFKLFKKHPVHDIPKVFKKETGFKVTEEEVFDIYNKWLGSKNYSFSLQLKDSKKADKWKLFEDRLTIAVNKEIADFMYHHWKTYQNKNK